MEAYKHQVSTTETAARSATQYFDGIRWTPDDTKVCVHQVTLHMKRIHPQDAWKNSSSAPPLLPLLLETI